MFALLLPDGQLSRQKQHRFRWCATRDKSALLFSSLYSALTLTDKTRVMPDKNLSLEVADVFSGSEYKENIVGDAR